jgi:hypothetical protein
MKSFFTIVLITFTAVVLAADNYNPGDTLYIWAKNGLNLRKSYAVTSPVIRKLDFGETVIVIEKTNEPYETALIEGLPHEEPDLHIDPFVCKGLWVKVKLLSGETGYVVDPYLLAMDPDAFYVVGNPTDPMHVIRHDTLWVNPDTAYNAQPIACLRLHHPYNVATEVCLAAIDSEHTYIFPGMTTEEALIFFAYEHDNYIEAIMSDFHHDGVRLAVNEMCNWTVSTNATETRIKEECAF